MNEKNEKTEAVLIKPQTINTWITTKGGIISINLHIEIKNHGSENCISINNRDIFFGKDGSYSGEGLDVRGKK